MPPPPHPHRDGAHGALDQTSKTLPWSVPQGGGSTQAWVSKRGRLCCGRAGSSLAAATAPPTMPATAPPLRLSLSVPPRLAGPREPECSHPCAPRPPRPPTTLSDPARANIGAHLSHASLPHPYVIVPVRAEYAAPRFVPRFPRAFSSMQPMTTSSSSIVPAGGKAGFMGGEGGSLLPWGAGGLGGYGPYGVALAPTAGPLALPMQRWAGQELVSLQQRVQERLPPPITVDIIERATAYDLTATVPGVKPSQVRRARPPALRRAHHLRACLTRTPCSAGPPALRHVPAGHRRDRRGQRAAHPHAHHRAHARGHGARG